MWTFECHYSQKTSISFFFIQPTDYKQVILNSTQNTKQGLKYVILSKLQWYKIETNYFNFPVLFSL